jgi:iron complex transport system ATP-binding protein
VGRVSALLEAHDLAIGHGAKVLVSEISFEVNPAEVLCLLGPNGAGKTTLFRTLLGLLPPLGGTINVRGRRLADLSRVEIAGNIAHVPQSLSTIFAFTALDIVLMGAARALGMFSRPGAREEARALAALDQVGISSLAHQEITQLSGGQRQLVAIARAIAQDAAIIVMDEPTASLDFANRIQVGIAIRALAERGVGVVLSTHDPEQAASLGDRALLLGHGSVIASGTIADAMTAENLSRLYGVAICREVDSKGQLRFHSM